MPADQSGRPIPKIVGRGKNNLKRPYSSHGYSLRSSLTHCQSSRDTPCQFCTHYNTLKEETEQYNSKVRKQLLKTTVRCLVTERWKREGDIKIRKLHGALQERANELREKELETQSHLRYARNRNTELQHCNTQLQSFRVENVELQAKLDSESRKLKVSEEIVAVRNKELADVKSTLKCLVDQLKPLLEDCEVVGSATDAESYSARWSSLRTIVDRVSRESNIPPLDTTNIQLSKEIVNQIIIEVICGVCQDMFIDPVALPCGHIFCEFCIRTWFKRSRACPVCRFRIITCGQLHAVYQFRQVVTILEHTRSSEERASRATEVVRRAQMRDEFYHDQTFLPARRHRDRGTTDRGERFVHRRRRIDDISSVPYHIPPDRILAPPLPLRTDQLAIPESFQPSFILPPNPPQPSVVNSEPGGEGPRTLMSMFLNNTFSSIDRFIRGGEAPRPLELIEYGPQQAPQDHDEIVDTAVDEALDEAYRAIQDQRPHSSHTVPHDYPPLLIEQQQPLLAQQYSAEQPLLAQQYSAEQPTTAGQYSAEQPTTAGPYSRGLTETVYQYIPEQPATADQYRTMPPVTAIVSPYSADQTVPGTANSYSYTQPVIVSQNQSGTADQTADYDLGIEGTAMNPILVPDYVPMERIRRPQTPPGEPPTRSQSLGDIIDDSSEEIWPESRDQNSPRVFITRDGSRDVLRIQGISEPDITLEPDGLLEVDGEYVYSGSSSEETESETGTESESDSATSQTVLDLEGVD